MFFGQDAGTDVYQLTDPSTGETTVIDQADLTNLQNSGVDLSSYEITNIGTATAITGVGVGANAPAPATPTTPAMIATPSASAAATTTTGGTGILGAISSLAAPAFQFLTAEQLASKGISPYGLSTMIGPNGQLMYQTPTTSNMSSLLLIGGAILAAVMIFKKKGKGGAAAEG